MGALAATPRMTVFPADRNGIGSQLIAQLSAGLKMAEGAGIDFRRLHHPYDQGYCADAQRRGSGLGF